MARLKGSVLGNLSGKLGNLSARTVQGQTILSARPSSVNVSRADNVVAIRNRFTVTASFAKSVKSIDDLSSIWDKAKLPRLSAINTIFKKNFAYSGPKNPTDQNIITPGGFQLDVTSASVTTDTISIDLGALNAYTHFSADEKDLSASVMLSVYDPIDSGDDFFKIITFKDTESDYDPSSALSLSLAIDQVQQNEIAKYNTKLLFVSVATKDADGKIVQYSDTYAQDV